MEFRLLQKISVYTTGFSFFVTVIFNAIFLSISGYMKYIKKDIEQQKNEKLEKFYIKFYFLTLLLFILSVVLWWEFLVYQAKPIP